jgi:CO/xanthine dehydrogenase FAD-binding subunit
MKPPPFRYLAPTSLDEALALRAQHGSDSVLLAGGQSLMPLLNLRIVSPAAVIDLGRVPELAGIRAAGGTLTIGAMTRQREVERSPVVGEMCPLLAGAVGRIAHPTIRNRGTIGGSLAHSDPAAELPAAALALGAEVVARSVRGERTIGAEAFFHGFLTTALEPDELLTEVRLPAAPGGWAIHEVTRRHGDFALVGVMALVRSAGGKGGGGAIEDARLALLGVGSTAIRAATAEDLLRGARPTEAVFAEAGEAAAAGLEPSSDVHATASYRRRVAAVLARRALQEATT